jgi:hypothetical protein
VFAQRPKKSYKCLTLWGQGAIDDFLSARCVLRLGDFALLWSDVIQIQVSLDLGNFVITLSADSKMRKLPANAKVAQHPRSYEIWVLRPDVSAHSLLIDPASWNIL